MGGAFADGVDVGIDHILADVAPDAGSGSRNGSPSDHPLVKGSFTLSSGQATTAPPTSTSHGNDESCTEEGPSWAGNGLLSKPTAISNSSSESFEFVLCTANCA